MYIFYWSLSLCLGLPVAFWFLSFSPFKHPWAGFIFEQTMFTRPVDPLLIFQAFCLLYSTVVAAFFVVRNTHQFWCRKYNWRDDWQRPCYSAAKVIEWSLTIASVSLYCQRGSDRVWATTACMAIQMNCITEVRLSANEHGRCLHLDAGTLLVAISSTHSSPSSEVRGADMEDYSTRYVLNRYHYFSTKKCLHVLEWAREFIIHLRFAFCCQRVTQDHSHPFSFLWRSHVEEGLSIRCWSLTQMARAREEEASLYMGCRSKCVLCSTWRHLD